MTMRRSRRGSLPSRVSRVHAMCLRSRCRFHRASSSRPRRVRRSPEGSAEAGTANQAHRPRVTFPHAGPSGGGVTGHDAEDTRGAKSRAKVLRSGPASERRRMWCGSRYGLSSTRGNGASWLHSSTARMPALTRTTRTGKKGARERGVAASPGTGGSAMYSRGRPRQAIEARVRRRAGW